MTTPIIDKSPSKDFYPYAQGTMEEFDLLVSSIFKMTLPCLDAFDEKIALLEKFIDRVSAYFPALKRYLFQLNILPAGIRLVMRRKKTLIPIQIFDDLPQCESAFEKLKSDPTFKLGIYSVMIFDEGRAEFDSFHRLTICVQKSHSTFHVFLLDSLGMDNEGLQNFISSWIWKIFDKQNTCLYAFKHDRQRDDFSCPIFSLKDAAFFARSPEKLELLKQFSTRQPVPQDADQRSIPLPLELLRMVQSRTLLTAFVKDSPLTEEQKAWLASRVGRYRVTLGDGRTLNLRSLHFACKYIREIFETTFATVKNPSYRHIV